MQNKIPLKTHIDIQMNKKTTFIAIVCYWATTLGLYAVPAKPTLVEYKQHDGSSISLYIRGDEKFHFYVSTDNYPMLVGEDGLLYYATTASNRIVPSNIKAKNIDERTTYERDWLLTLDKNAVWENINNQEKSIRRAAAQAPHRKTEFPTIGEHKALVIVVEYADVKFTLDDPQDYYHRMLNETGFSENGGTGSARDYYIQCSDSLYLPDFDVYGPVTLSQEMSYYGANDWYGNDQNPDKMVIEACQQLDEQIDFSLYDTDNDGKVDNVYIFYAGYGEASGGSAETVWPHSWDLSSAGSSLSCDGKQIEHYACSNEVEGGNFFDGIGTFCHEYGHVLGLPDIYATSYTSAYTPGAYSLMDLGSYNNDSRTPPALSAYERYELNWITPIPIHPVDTVFELPHILDSNKAYILNVGRNPDEYFLLENRQQVGWDAYIPGHGMLIWHIDYDEYIWQTNTVNNSYSHQYIDIEEADDKRSDSNQDGDTFPGAENITSISDDTSPSLCIWDGTKSNREIYEITENNGLITFRVANTGIIYYAPNVLEPENITASSATLRWEKVENAIGYILNVYHKEEGYPQSVILNLNVGDTDTYDVTGLEPSTTYYYTLRSEYEQATSPSTEEFIFTTDIPTFEYKSPYLEDASNLTPSSFTITWQPLEEAVSYQVYVYTKDYDNITEEKYDFTEKLQGLPQGWSTSATSCYGVEGYYGEAFPSLRFNNDQQGLYTNIQEKKIQEFTFWYRGISHDYQPMALNIMGYDVEKKSWVKIETIDVSNDAATYHSDNIDERYSAIGVVAEIPISGYIVIDDIVVKYADVNYKMLNNYNGLETTECALTVEELNPDITYYCHITAYNGEVYSRPSNEVCIYLSTGISQVDNQALRIINHAGSLYIENSCNKVLKGSLYTIAGQEVAKVTLLQGTTPLQLPACGIYILKVGNNSYKVAK